MYFFEFISIFISFATKQKKWKLKYFLALVKLFSKLFTICIKKYHYEDSFLFITFCLITSD